MHETAGPGSEDPPHGPGNRLTPGLGRAFLLIFVASFLIQCFILTKVPARYVEPHTRWEARAIAVSLAETGRFADPRLRLERPDLVDHGRSPMQLVDSTGLNTTRPRVAGQRRTGCSSAMRSMRGRGPAV